MAVKGTRVEQHSEETHQHIHVGRRSGAGTRVHDHSTGGSRGTRVDVVPDVSEEEVSPGVWVSKPVEKSEAQTGTASGKFKEVRRIGSGKETTLVKVHAQSLVPADPPQSDPLASAKTSPPPLTLEEAERSKDPRDQANAALFRENEAQRKRIEELEAEMRKSKESKKDRTVESPPNPLETPASITDETGTHAADPHTEGGSPPGKPPPEPSKPEGGARSTVTHETKKHR